jgi:hypothetical protein
MRRRAMRAIACSCQMAAGIRNGRGGTRIVPSSCKTAVSARVPQSMAQSWPAYQAGIAKRVKQFPQERGTILFDVVFEDGSRASNRRVPMEILSDLDGDRPAHDLI